MGSPPLEGGTRGAGSNKWRMRTSAGSATTASARETDWPRSTAVAKNTINPTAPARPVFRLKNSNTNAGGVASRLAMGIIPYATPTAGASPAPPRKRMNMGYQWPTIAAAPAARASQGWAPAHLATSTGRALFAASPSSTAIPAPLPIVWNTLAAPGLAVPI